MKRQKLYSILVFVLFSCCCSTAWAQAIDQNDIRISDPARIQKPDLRKSQDSTTPSSTIEEQKKTALPMDAENINITLQKITLKGNSLYSLEKLTKIFKDNLGQEIPLSRLYEIADEITAFYRNNGYILSQAIIPPQAIDEGVVTIQIIEGFIDQIKIEGEEGKSVQKIQAYTQDLNNGTPLNNKDLERALLLINDLPGITARSILSPSPTLAGAADLLIKVERKKYEALTRIDNHGSRFLGPWQTTLVGYGNSLLGSNEQIRLYAVAAPDDDLELGYVNATYTMPLGNKGTTIEFTASHAQTKPGFTLKEFDVEGRSTNLAATLRHPLIRSRGLNLSLYGTIDSRHSETKTNITNTTVDNIRTLRTGGTLDYTDKFLGGGINRLNLELSKGTDVFDASIKGDANMSRQEGNPQFTKLEASYERLQKLSTQLYLLTAVKGQLSNAPLLSAEEFGLGGSSWGRGYDNSEIIGDEGIAGKAELQWQRENHQIFGFYDVGRIWNKNPTDNTLQRNSLASAGSGIRLFLPGNISSEILAALPLTREVDTQQNNNVRFLFNLQKLF